MTEAGVNTRLSQVGKSGVSGFDYTYEPELKKLVAEQEKQANGFKVSSVQGMTEAGVNQRLNQVGKSGVSGFDYTYEPELKKLVAEQEKQANGFKVSSVQGMSEAGVNTRLMQMKRPVTDDDIIDGNGSYEHPKVDEGYPFALT